MFIASYLIYAKKKIAFESKRNAHLSHRSVNISIKTSSTDLKELSNMSTKHTYYAPTGGLPPQTQLISDRAIFTEAYAIIPKRVLTDIVISYLPFWENMRMWVIARPLSGFSETFSQYIVEVGANGGSNKPELDESAEAVLFVVEGEMEVSIEGVAHQMQTGGYAYLPARFCSNQRFFSYATLSH